jgi:hypothetical protein
MTLNTPFTASQVSSSTNLNRLELVHDFTAGRCLAGVSLLHIVLACSCSARSVTYAYVCVFAGFIFQINSFDGKHTLVVTTRLTYAFRLLAYALHLFLSTYKNFDA